ncbi:Uncharacterized protein KIAA0930-like [Papilio xuthus]|uniref:Uncharacterized protein KIAA0930-like n=1 Tax=Papilio xuthus TaxID=66420 RepID=A0A194QCB0_PAPXU|nr:Uncharacterized protein KIAA0930-like [Papilio xuthus]
MKIRVKFTAHRRVYASPSRRKMDTKGEGEEMTYPHICFMVDNFDEVRTSRNTPHDHRKLSKLSRRPSSSVACVCLGLLTFAYYGYEVETKQRHNAGAGQGRAPLSTPPPLGYSAVLRCQLTPWRPIMKLACAKSDN